MKKTLTYMVLMVCTVLAGCQRRPLYDDFGGRLYLDIEIETEVARGYNPVGMNVTFYDLDAHTPRMNTITGPTGGFINIDPDTYDLMVYNYDTEYTRVREEGHLLRAEAYTDEAPGQVRHYYEMLKKALAETRGESSRAYADEPLINQPDHLYVGTVDKVVVPVCESEDEFVRIHVKATSVLETYKLIVRTVQGMRYVNTAEAFVTGQASSLFIHDRVMSGGPATLYVPIEAEGEHEYTSTFTTFGKYDRESGKVFVVLRLVDRNDKVYTWEFDVTDQVDSGSHVIIVDADIRIEPTDGAGGFAPSINEWEDIITNIDI